MLSTLCGPHFVIDFFYFVSLFPKSVYFCIIETKNYDMNYFIMFCLHIHRVF